MADTVRLPTEEEILSLPRWARVAFAARCARRAQPLYVLAWPEAPREHVEVLDKALALCESSARAGQIEPSLIDAADAAQLLSASAASHAAYAAHANGAFHAALAAHAADDDAAHTVTVTGRALLVAAIARDFADLKALAASENWTGDSPVDPDRLGPLWPDGEPYWKALANDAAMKRSPQATSGSSEPDPQLPLLEFEITPGNATPTMIASYLTALSNLFHACGGVSLRFKRVGSKVYAMAEAPA